MTPKEFEHPIKGPRESSLFSYNELCEFAQAYADEVKLKHTIEALEDVIHVDDKGAYEMRENALDLLSKYQKHLKQLDHENR